MSYLATNDPAACVVLDTNVVLDWLLFADPGVAAVVDALQSGRARWLTCPRMRDEFEHTLLRTELARWQPDHGRLLARFDAHATLLEVPDAASSLRCTDPTDQVFIDLAFENRAGWLLSRDRAVLKLRRRAAAFGLRIAHPADWSPF